MVKIVPATAEMVTAVMPYPLPTTIYQATAVIEGDQVLAVAGYQIIPDGLLIGSAMSDAARADLPSRVDYKRALVTVTRRLLAATKAMKMPVFATADPVPHAEEMLHHFGFRNHGGIYQWQCSPQ